MLADFEVDARPFRIGQVAADLVLIDLDRLPSHGREVAVWLRGRKATKLIPIVFAGGVPEKVERIRQEIPDAVYTAWNGVAAAVRKALKNAPARVVQPVPHMQRYAGSPLEKKLGLRAGMTVALVGAPDGFDEQFSDVTFETRVTRDVGLAICFVRSRTELDAVVELPCTTMWIVAPKKAGRYKVDFNLNDVRTAGLAAGLVDYKICAVDDDWSGLKFKRKNVEKSRAIS
jgi:hypothetical protein